MCPYGGNCYRKNPQHKTDMAHPGDSDFELPEESESDPVSLYLRSTLMCFVFLDILRYFFPRRTNTTPKETVPKKKPGTTIGRNANSVQVATEKIPPTESSTSTPRRPCPVERPRTRTRIKRRGIRMTTTPARTPTSRPSSTMTARKRTSATMTSPKRSGSQRMKIN